ncbi:MAG: peptidoglycan-binding protein [Nodosilinea sp.]
MDSLAQCHLWLTWETSPDAVSSLAMPTAVKARSAWLASTVAIAAGAIVLGSSLSTPVLASNRFGNTIYVNTPEGYALNVRWGPSTSNGVYRRVRRGSALQVSGVRRNGWVQLVDATWVAGNLVSTFPVGGTSIDPPVDNRNLATVITPQNFALNIRSGPGRDFPVVGQFVNGSRIAVTGRFRHGWAQLINGNWVDGSRIQYSGPVQNDNRPTPTPDPIPSDDVRELQRLLIEIGYLPPFFVISGLYNEATQAAVREFQRDSGLPVTGNVNAATWQALYRAAEQQRPTPDPDPTPDSPPAGSRQMRVVTDGDSTSVFDGPGTEFGFLRDVPNGSIVTVTGRESGNWSELIEGGWIFSLWLDEL